MLIRTIKVDVERYLEDLWLLYVADLKASKEVAASYNDLVELINQDFSRVKTHLEVLKDLNIIDVEEYRDMRDKSRNESDKVIESFNKTA